MPSTSSLASSVSAEGSPTIAVIGLGYVGLPLCLQFARSGVTVIGLDVDQAKVDTLNAKQSFIKHIADEDVAVAVDSGSFRASFDFCEIQSVKAVIVCVPTPLGEHREPDISYVLKSGEAIASHLQKGTLVVLESTTYPGTTEGPLKDALEKGSGLVAGTDFYLAYSPEREDPGRTDHSVASIPKVVGGYTPACLEKAMSLYGKAVETPYPVNSCAVAEACKLTENIFRSVNIALVNELKIVYQAMGIDVWEVINAAATKPFGYMPFYPGPGLGGHCIPIDPFYLTWKAREYHQNTNFIELAGVVNTAMPEYVIDRVVEALNDQGKSVRNSRILLLGIAYKPNVDDDRESPSYRLLDLLNERGAALDYFDPHVPEIRPTREHPHWAGKRTVEWKKEVISSYDLVLIATQHQAVNYQEIGQWAPCVVDTRNVMASVPDSKAKVYKA